MPRRRRNRDRRFVPIRLRSPRANLRQMSRMSRRQHIHYVNSADGTRLAWAESRDGPLRVKAANWLTHFEYEWESPVWKHWIQFFSSHFRFVRYDERGCGMSEWRAGNLSLDDWATMRRTSSISSGSGRGRRRLCSRGTTASRDRKTGDATKARNHETRRRTKSSFS